MAGQRLVTEEKYDKAIIAFQNAIKFEPKNASIHLEFGKGLIKMGKPTEALGKLQRTIELDPNSGEAHLEMAKLFHQPQYYRLCEHHAEKVTIIDPGNRGRQLDFCVCIGAPE